MEAGPALLPTLPAQGEAKEPGRYRQGGGHAGLTLHYLTSYLRPFTTILLNYFMFAINNMMIVGEGCVRRVGTRYWNVKELS